MAKRVLYAPYAMKAYRVVLTLTWNEWAKLREEAKRNGLTGAAQVELILNDVLTALPEPRPDPVDEPLPADPGDDMVDLS